MNGECIEGLEVLYISSRTQVGSFDGITSLNEWEFGREAQVCGKDDALPLNLDVIYRVGP